MRRAFVSFVAICTSVLPAFAGPLFPCPKAASSRNGNFLVVTELETASISGAGATIQRAVLNIYARETFINAHQRLNSSSGPYWRSTPDWSVALEEKQVDFPAFCPVALVTDDGEFLVLLRTGMVNSGNSAVLRIYRRANHTGQPIVMYPDHGVITAEIKLNQLWPAARLAGVAGVWDDESPEWFAGGTFEFSPDNRQLWHKTRWGNTAHIYLADGSVTK